ncbi:pheromone processing endoprotease [Coemansia spiralis]|uniref:Pheromone processing endoprotease n=1 Tax=Coemansia spiralis TaxID=417178 RepID=A0A9W8GJI2_9FUNG|nr:pheromone processing endoprotease [Coemansia spiralis]
MRIGVLELVALSALLFASAVHTAVPLDRRSSLLRSWREQAALEPHPVPLLQTDPLYDYTAIKFPSNGSVDSLAAQYAERTGWENVGRLGQLDAYRVFRQRKGGRLVRRHLEGGVRLSQGKRLVKRGLVGGFGNRQASSNDTAWRDITDPLYSTQWHLVNTKEIGHDINVTGVWHQGITGAGVTVALIDDGLDYSSEDLLDNFDFKGSYDFNDKTKLPTPRLVEDYHGTRCAGQIAASRNDVCGVGVAYGARVAGIRMLSKEVSDQDEVTALNYEMDTNWIYSCSWGPSDDGATVQGPDQHIEDAFVNGVEKGRSGLGSIFVFATGNGGAAGDNCNFDGYTNSIYTISIGAIDHLDKHPYYSEQCSAQLAVTYSNGAQRGVVTTDLGLRSCTDKHGGTSAAAPLGAGIFALALSVRPDLTWRDVQHVAVRAALPVDTGDSDWTDVAEGRRYNHKYGFGKMDAWRIVETAKTMKHVGKQTSIACPRDEAHTEIPVLSRQGAPSESASRKIEITAAQVAVAKMRRIEHVTVVVDMSHDYRGNVEIWLESPHGIRSQLATVRQHDSSNQGLADWRFMSVKHWGEDPVGVWTLHVRNAYLPKHRGTLKAWQLTVFGESTDPDTRPTLPPPSSGPGPNTGGEHNPPPPAKPVEVDDQGTNSMQKVYSLMVPLVLVLGSGIVSALAMLVYMRRRERKLADMRWTALDAIGNSTIEEEGFRPRGGGASTGRPEDDEDTEVFEIAQTASGSSGAYKLPANEAVSLTDDEDDRTKGADSTETERLV